MFDVTAIGELLIDFTPKTQGEKVFFEQNPGGAPANVLVANARLGGKNAFIGKVGEDGFGAFLNGVLNKNKINATGLVKSKDYKTTLAFVQLDEHGDRSFSFYRNPGADIMLTFDEVDKELLKNTHIMHFGSVSLTDEPVRSATLKAVSYAKENGAIISYDPNYRPPLWKDFKTAKKEMTNAVKLADIIKLSNEELYIITGEKDLLCGAEKIKSMGPKLVLVTCGEKGAFYLSKIASGKVSTYNVKTVDTNGAGDTFFGAFLFCLKDKTLEEIENLSKNELDEIVAFSNAAGALATTKSGAMPAMPNIKEIEDCMKNVGLLVG